MSYLDQGYKLNISILILATVSMGQVKRWTDSKVAPKFLLEWADFKFILRDDKV